MNQGLKKERKAMILKMIEYEEKIKIEGDESSMKSLMEKTTTELIEICNQRDIPLPNPQTKVKQQIDLFFLLTVFF